MQNVTAANGTVGTITNYYPTRYLCGCGQWVEYRQTHYCYQAYQWPLVPAPVHYHFDNTNQETLERIEKKLDEFLQLLREKK